MKGNVIQMNTLHLNSVRLNGIGKVQSVSLKGGSTEDPVFPPVEPPIGPTPTYTLSASVTNGMVSAKRNGSAVNLPFTANEGDTIIVEVTPNDGYEFNGWADGNTDNPRSITMNADVALSAQCVEVVQPPVGNYIQFEDAEIERVLMSKGVSSDGVGITIEDAEKVTSISTWFKGNTAITSFEEFKYFKNCTSLEASAFDGCSALNALSFPSSITSIGSSACRNVPAPMVLNLPNLRTIGTAAFYGSGLTEIKDLGKVSVIGTTTAVVSSSQGAFADCKALTKVHIPSSVTHIGGMSFIGCDALASVSGCEGVTNIVRQQAFDRCSALVGELILPSIKVVDQYSFRNCGLTKVDLGADATTIAAYAFQNNTAMTAFICRATTPPSLANINAFTNTNNCPIYVPDASLEAYKTATNWNQYADRIHPLSEIEDYYVSDALLMHLDGINKGNVEGEWQDLVSGNTFVNHGAIAEADGWRFDGASSYMDSATLITKGWWQSRRTIEVVVVFDDINTAKSEVVFMGRKNCFAFGKYLNEHFVNSATYSVRSTKIQHFNNIVAYGFSLDNETSPQGIINGQIGVMDYGNAFSDAETNIAFLGKRATGSHFKGKIYAIRLHDRVLSQEEILYNQRIDNKRYNLGLDI